MRWLALMMFLAACNDDGKDTDVVDTDPVDTTVDAVDADDDGVPADDDCDDDDPNVFPGADERCNGVDDDCDDVIDGPNVVDGVTQFTDADADGFGAVGSDTYACADPARVDAGGDCDDGDAEISPDALERCDGVDNDCDGTVDGGTPCANGDCTVDVSVARASIAGLVTWDGEPIDDRGPGREWQLVLTDTTGYVVTRDFDGGSAYAATLHEGTYRVDVRLLDRRAVADRPFNDTWRGPTVDITGNVILDIDVAPVQLSGSVSYNGTTINDFDPAAPEWRLVITDDEGRRYERDFDAGTNYSVAVLPGTFDVDFELVQPRAVDALPIAFGAARIATDLDLSADTTLDVAPEVVALTGQTNWNGNTLRPTITGAEYELRFTDTTTGLVRLVGIEAASTYATRVYLGSYDVAFRLLDDLTVPDPVLSWASLGTVVATSDAIFDVEVDTHTVSGVATYDGEPVTRLSFFIPEFSLVFVDPRTGDEGAYDVNIGAASDYAIDVLEGTYDVYFELVLTGAVNRPVTQRVLVDRGVVVGGATDLDLDLGLVELSGAVTVDGQVLADVGSDPEWRVTLVSEEDTWELSGSGGSYEALVWPGTYDVYFEQIDSTAGVGASGETRVASGVTLSAGTEVFDVDARTVRLSGALSYDGAPLDDVGVAAEATLVLDETEVGQSYPLPLQAASTYEVRTYPGVYDLGFLLEEADAVAGSPVLDLTRVAACVTLD